MKPMCLFEKQHKQEVECAWFIDNCISEFDECLYQKYCDLFDQYYLKECDEKEIT